MRRLDLSALIGGASPTTAIQSRRRTMVLELCRLIGFGRWVGEVEVWQVRTFRRGTYRFYEIPGESLYLVEAIRWTLAGDVHTFTIKGCAPAPSRVLQPTD